MKDSVTRFNFADAFKALDEIEIPVAEKGIRANRVDLKESMKKVDKFELLFEDFYDVNNADDMNTVSEEREAEVAKAKLARIEKIVDLDAETEDDILPSYVGKTIIQCPQCMTLFYKNAEDIVRDEENPDVVNVNEVCQHCGNEGGYDVVGKVAEETEAAPGDELGTDDFSAEVGDGENDIAIDDGSETTEEAPVAEESGEVDELSAEADLDSLDLDTELDLEEEPVEEEKEVEESLNTSELLKEIEDDNELKTENESDKLTLNEDIEDNLDDKLKAHEEYIKDLRDTISELEKKLAGTKNEQIKASIQSRIDATRAELEAALPEAVKAEAETEELPDATEAGMEDATDNTSEETEETTESLHEAVEGMTDTLNRAWEVAKKTSSPMGVTVIAPAGADANGKIKDWSQSVNANLYYVNAKDPDLMANGFDEAIMSRPNTIILVDEFDTAPAKNQEAISAEIDYLDEAVEMVIVTSHNSDLSGDNFKRFKQFVANIETEVKEALNESLTEANTIPSTSEANISKLFNSDEFKKPVSEEEVKSFFEAVEDEFEDAEVTVEGEAGPVKLTQETDTLTETNIFKTGGEISRIFGGQTKNLAAVVRSGGYKYLYLVPFLSPEKLGLGKNTASEYRKLPWQSKIVETNAAEMVSKANITKQLNSLYSKAKELGKSLYKEKTVSKISNDSIETVDIKDNGKVVAVWFVLTTTKLNTETEADLLKLVKAGVDSNQLTLIGIYYPANDSYDFNLNGKGLVNRAKDAKKDPDSKKSKNTTDDTEEDDLSSEVATTATTDSEEETTTDSEEKTETGLTDDKKTNIINKLVEKKLQFVAVSLGKDTMVAPISVAPDAYSEVEFKEAQTLCKGGHSSGTDTAVIVVSAEEGSTICANGLYKELADRDTKILELYKDGKLKEEHFEAIAAKFGITLGEALDISDIDDKSFNEKLTESLTAVYKNVENFTMTDCELNESMLTIYGDIKFTSGKTKNTKYIFEALQGDESKTINLTGSNKDLFENGKINIKCSVLKESIQAASLNYKYTIEDDLVEGTL